MDPSVTSPRAPSEAPPPAPGPDSRPAESEQRSDDVPELAAGIELIGEYEDSGLKEPPHIARRADGQVIQLSPLLYSVAASIDGDRGYREVGEAVSREIGRRVSADNVRFLVEKKLRPLGVVAAADGASQKLRRADPMLALNFRAALVPERVVHGITTVLRPLFLTPVIVAVIAGLLALDAWLFLGHGIGASARELAYQPAFILVLLGLVVLSAAFHECGHATACRYGGAKPGVMGAGIYLVWPVFYTDVTDAYRLGRTARLRTDLGGIYFNAIFSLVTAGAYFATGFEPLLLVIVVQHIEMLHQMLPFLRLDGYYVMTDMTGVPDILSRVKPTLASLIPGREAGPRVKELKPWARVVTSAYVIMLVPLLGGVLLLILITAPRFVATAYDSLLIHYDEAAEAFGGGQALAGVANAVQMGALALPVLGIGLTLVRATKRSATGAWRRSDGRPLLRAGYGSVAAAVAAGIVVLWWPNEEYRPIQPTEGATLQSLVSAVPDLPTLRPGLTEQRAAELGGAPTVREQGGDFRDVYVAPASGDGGGAGAPSGTAEPESPEQDSQSEASEAPGDTEPTEAPSGGAEETDEETEEDLSGDEDETSPNLEEDVDGRPDGSEETLEEDTDTDSSSPETTDPAAPTEEGTE